MKNASVPAVLSGKSPATKSSIKMPEGKKYTHGINEGSHGRGGALAKVKGAPSAASGGIPNPVRKPNSGLRNQRIGQPNPDTGAAATKKPKRKGLGAAFYGE